MAGAAVLTRRAVLLDGLIPAAARAAETRRLVVPTGREDLPDDVRRSVAARQREFLTGRACARLALDRLAVDRRGRRGTIVGRRADRAPVWPAGIHGSITHCPGYAAAVVLRADEAVIGIDAEPHAPLPPGVLERIATPGELDRLSRGPGAAARVLFSCKESLYKLWHPLTGQPLRFLDVEVEIDPTGTFCAGFVLAGAHPPLPAGLTGRWQVRDGLVLSVVTAPAQ